MPAIEEDALQQALDTLRTADRRAVQRAGYHFQPNDYYSPLNDVAFLDANRDLWEGVQPCPDLDFNGDRQLAVAREIAPFLPELRSIPETTENPVEYAWRNNFWNNADALVQYGLVRARRPKRYIEVGCGWSSLLLMKALERNAAEDGGRTEVTTIEPYPRADLFATFPRHWVNHPVMLQRAPLEVFDALGAGDILFYDGSHAAKAASDVNWFFFRVLPRLKAGVLIHLHDIFLPFDYPEHWLFERTQSWNEQYLLQAFLMNNPRYSIEIANRWLWAHHRPTVEVLYQGIQPSIGCSFWMVKR